MQKRQTYAQRLKISVDDKSEVSFFTRSKLQIANGHIRVVIGKRGPYVEFAGDQIIRDNIYIPKDKEYKLQNEYPYYHEYRSKDEYYVKLYYQQMTVSYADYKVGLWYASPSDLIMEEDGEFVDVIGPLYVDIPSNLKKEKDNQLSLWDVV